MSENEFLSIPAPWELAYARLSDMDAIAGLDRASLDWRPVGLPCDVQTSPFGLPLGVLYKRDNIERVRWMQDVWWVFRTTFTAPPAGGDEEAVYCFKGIDYRCHVLLNGRPLCVHEGMFSPVTVPLENPGEESTLEVWLEPFTDSYERPETLKARYSFGRGWDFAPRLQPRGIWDEAGILVRKRLRVTGVAMGIRLRNQQRADITVHVDLSERVACGRVTVVLDGVTRTFPIVNADRLALPLNIPSPTLWWPNGAGEPRLLQLDIVLDVPGRETEPYRRRVGLRELERVACEGQGAEDIPLQLVVNGRPIFLKGVNWVPLDACPGSITSERYETFLRCFKEAGVNFVRVWGGGLAEKDAFYDLADELGLLVMQEFPLACQELSRSDRFLGLLAREAEAIVQRLKAHPSLAIWSGGNEHYHYWDSLDSGTARANAVVDEVKRQFGIGEENRAWLAGADRYNEPALALLGQICATHDGTRPFQITSAMEGEGELHGIWTWNPAIGDQRYRDFDSFYAFWLQAREHLFSEASVPSLANPETIRAVLGAGAPPLPERNDPVWRLHHTFGAAWESEDTWLDLPSLDTLFGRIDGQETLALASQWLQGEAARFLVEETRRKMGRTAGVVWWGVNEPWPGLAGNALIDYYGRPKLGWRFLANAFSPTILSLRYENCVGRRIKPELWISHDGTTAFAGTYRIEIKNLKTGGEDVYDGKIECGCYRSLYIRTLVPVRLSPGVKVHAQCTLYAGEVPVHRNDYFFASHEDEAPLREILPLIAGVYRNN